MSTLNVDTIADELGTGGPDFAGMPTVAGDPVVESGSNSDGEWTRWADGTQEDSIPVLLSDLANATGEIVVPWNFPASFTAAGPSHISMLVFDQRAYNDPSDANMVSSSTVASRQPFNNSGASASLRIVAPSGTFTSGTTRISVSAKATGRWK